jgi:predicted membrane protein
MDNNIEPGKTDRKQRRRHSGAGTGLIFIFIGGFFLLRSFNLDLPHWVISWETLLIGIGFWVLVASQFKNVGGLMMMLIGGVFLAREIFDWSWDMAKVTWPVVMIVVGVSLLFKRRNHTKEDDTMLKADHFVPGRKDYSYIPEGEDYLNTSVIFSGEDKKIVSKNFKGGSVNAVFGGADINLLQADFNGQITIDVNCVFGGVDLIVPSNWNVKVLVHTTIFAGVEDKRPIEMLSNDADKVLLITGSCIFGGIEIKSYT